MEEFNKNDVAEIMDLLGGFWDLEDLKEGDKNILVWDTFLQKIDYRNFCLRYDEVDECGRIHFVGSIEQCCVRIIDMYLRDERLID